MIHETRHQRFARFKELAAAILQRHERGELEANITSAVRDFLIETQLAKSGVIDEEIPPSDRSPACPCPKTATSSRADAPGFGMEIKPEWITPWDHTAAMKTLK